MAVYGIFQVYCTLLIKCRKVILMKKLLIMLLTLCLFLFFSCGGNGQTESGDESVHSFESSAVNSEESTADTTDVEDSSEERSEEESSTVSEESSEEESSEASEESSFDSEESSSSDTVDAFCGGRFDGKDSVKVVALGDSIPRGYGLSNPSAEAFPALFSQSLEAVLGGAKVNYANIAVDGMTTGGLLTLLQNDSSALNGADIVVLCIGANNILGPFTEALNDANSNLSGGATNDSQALGAFMDEFNALLKSEKLAADMNVGIAKAASDIPQILKLIKNRAPNAIVAVMTVYSPYHGIVMSIPYLGKSVNMGEVSDMWVSSLNTEIRKAVAAEGCLLVETYDAFAAGADLVNAAFSLVPFKFSFDPHPTVSGHIKLANLYMASISNM